MGKVILVVDDDAVLVRATSLLAKRYIDRVGAEADVLQTKFPAEAIRLVKERALEAPGTVWCILTDFDMPEMNGGELIAKLGQLLGNRLKHRVVVSGREENEEEAKRRGALFVRKPYDKSDLEEAVEPFLDLA